MLTNLSQIKGGKALFNDVESLKTWKNGLDATQILTTILSDPEDATSKRTVNDVLRSLLGEGESSGEGYNSIKALSDALIALEGKTIKDVVRTNLTATYASNAFSVDVTGVAQDIRNDAANAALRVYTTDGRAVYGDANGATQLTLNLATGAFSGTPYLMVDNVADRTQDETEVGVTKFEAIEETFNFKVFATGTYTLDTLPADALLDNQEMQSIAYDQAIDKIVLQLASDEDLIANIKALVGTTAVQQQIANITDTLYRYSAITGTAAVGEEGDADYVAAETISNTTPVYSAAKVDQLLQNSSGNATTEINKKHDFSAITTVATDVTPVTAVSTFGASDYVAGLTGATAEGAATKSTVVYSGALVDLKIEQAIKAALETASAAVYAVDAKTYDFANIEGLATHAAQGEVGDVNYVAATTAETVGESTVVYSKAAVDYLLSVLQADVDLNESTAPKLAQLVGTPEVRDAVTDEVTQAAEVISQSTQIYTKNSVDKAIADAVAGGSASSLTHIQNNANRIDAVEAACVPHIETFNINATTAFTTFTLTNTPNAVPVKMFINGIVYFEGDEFTVNRSNNTVNWSFTASEEAGHTEGVDGFTINNTVTSKVRIEYFSGAFVTRTVPTA